MTIANTIIHQTVFGDTKVIFGKSVLSGGSSSGDVATGLRTIYGMNVNIAGTTQMGHSIDETFPLTGSDPTVYVESANSTFYWTAWGHG